MVNGSIIPAMVMHGYPPRDLISCLTQRAAIGSLQTMGGHGLRITTGDGHHFTMEDGNMMVFMVGYGYPIHNGARPGCRGEEAKVIMAGHRLALAYPSI